MNKLPSQNGISTILATALYSSALAGILTLTSCAPDPTLQKQMDQDILTAAEKKQATDRPGPHQGIGNQGYGLGGF